MRCISNFVFVFALTACSVQSNASTRQCELRTTAGQIYISDTHAGFYGQCSDGKACRDGWHNIEDFRWSEEFARFIGEVDKTAGTPLDLVIVGDFLELWQDVDNVVPCGKDSSPRSNSGCNAAQASQRVAKTIEKHPDLFKTLANFAAKQQHKLVIVPGNHDAALVIDNVAATLLRAFPESVRSEVCVDSDGLLYTSFGDYGVLVEHGHQIKGDLNRYSTPKNGVVECIDANDKVVDCNAEQAWLRRTWGENFVQNYYNDHESRLPVIDNYSFEPAGLPDGVKRGFKASRPEQRSQAIWSFVNFFMFQQTFAHIRAGLGDKSDTRWVCAANTREICIDAVSMKLVRLSDPIFSELPPGQKDLLMLVFTVEGQKDPTLGAWYSANPGNKEDIDNLLGLTCQYWAIERQKEKGNSSEPANLPTCSYRNLGLGAFAIGISQYMKGLIDPEYNKVIEHIEGREQDLPGKVTHFIYGHTHKAMACRHSNGKEVYNTGAWQRVASAETIGDIIDLCVANSGKNADACFREMTVNDLPARYTLVADLKGSRPQLLVWATNNEGKYSFMAESLELPSCK